MADIAAMTTVRIFQVRLRNSWWSVDVNLCSSVSSLPLEHLEPGVELGFDPVESCVDAIEASVDTGLQQGEILLRRHVGPAHRGQQLHQGDPLFVTEQPLGGLGELETVALVDCHSSFPPSSCWLMGEEIVIVRRQTQSS